MSNKKRTVTMVGFDGVLFKNEDITDDLTQQEQNYILDTIRELSSADTISDIAGELKFKTKINGKNVKINGWYLSEVN